MDNEKIDLSLSGKQDMEKWEHTNIVEEALEYVKVLHMNGQDDQIADYVRKTFAQYKGSAFAMALYARQLGISANAFGFCPGITHILDGGFYGIANKGYYPMRLKIGTSTDSDHDRAVYGDKTTNRFQEGRFKWSFRPIDGTPYYYLVNKGNEWGEMYLKLALKIDKYKDRLAFAAPYKQNEKRFKWYVTVQDPYVNNFVIYSLQGGSSEYWMPLKLSSCSDRWGDREAWGDGNMIGYPSRTVEDRFQWSIEEI